MGSAVRNQIFQAVQAAGAFSLIADESKDSSKVEQLAIVLQYVHVDDAQLHEAFLTFVPAEDLTAGGISSYILDTLKNHQLDPTCMVSQGCHEWSNFWGANTYKGNCSSSNICSLQCNLCLVGSVLASK